MIQIKNLSKTYASGVHALKNLNLEIEAGEIFGFLGSNGAGKSTAIKILTTLSKPTGGTFSIAGIDPIKNPSGLRETIGYVAQEAGVDYFLTGRENLVLQGRLYHLPYPVIAERAAELLNLFDLKEVADSLVSTYSGGMQRKLDIATALVHRPKVLFLDEPTLGLDPRSRMTLWDHIRALNKTYGMTIFLTTHYLEEAEKLSRRIGILDEGELKVIGAPEKLRSEIGGDSINFICESDEKRESQNEKWSQFKFKPYIDHLVYDRNEVRMYVKNELDQQALPVGESGFGGNESKANRPLNKTDALLRVMADAEAMKLEVETLSFSRATLDDVFLKYTGKSLEHKKETSEAEPWWKKWQKSGQGSDEWKKWQKTEEGESVPGITGDGLSGSPGKQGSGSASPSAGPGGIGGATAPHGPPDEIVGDASPSKWGKWTEAEMKEWWAKNGK